MSVIDKYPFINAVLTSLSDEDLASLQACVNGQGAPNVFKSILAGSPYLLKTTDKGVYPVDLEVARSGSAQTVYPGFLIFNDEYCVLISFATERSQILTVLNLTHVNGLWKSEIKPFELSITDLRSELFDVAGGSGGGSGGGGSGESVALYKHSINNISIYDSDVDEISTGNVLSFLSKYAEPFVSNGSLTDVLLFVNDKNDAQIIISPTLGHSEGSTTMVANIMPTDDEMYFVAAIGGSPSFRFVARYADNASDITDTVEPYIQVSGGSGGSDSPVAGGSGKLYQYDFTLKVYDNGAEPEYNLSFLLYESNFERLKQIAAQQEVIINSPQDIATFINSLAQTTTQSNPTYVSQFVLFGALVDKVLNTDRGFFEELVADIFVGGFYGPEGQSPRISLVNDTTEPATYYGLNTNNSCTLTEYGTSGDSQGGGSGTSTTEFHAENGLIQMKGVYTAGGLDYTISSYISGKDLLTFVLAMKQASPLFRDLPVTQDTTTAELVEILQNAMDSVDQNVLACLGYYFLEAGFGISIDQAGFGVNGEGVSSLYFDDSGTFPNGDAFAYYSYKGGQKQLLFYANDVTNATFELNELTSGEITISGGSGSDIDLSNLQVGHLTFSNDQSIGLKSMGSTWSVLTLSFDTQNDSYTFNAKYMCSEEEMYDLFNDKLEQYRQQGLTIPTVTDHATLTQAFNTIVDTLFALDSEGAGLSLAGFITLMFGPSVYGPFQGFMTYSGTTLYSLIRSGDDFGMCILDAQGQRVDVLTTLVNDIGTTKPTNISLWIND